MKLKSQFSCLALTLLSTIAVAADDQPLRLRGDLKANYELGSKMTFDGFKEVVKLYEEYMTVEVVLEQCTGGGELARKLDTKADVAQFVESFVRRKMDRNPNLGDNLGATVAGSIETSVTAMEYGLYEAFSKAMKVYDDETYHAVCERAMSVAPKLIEKLESTRK